MTSPSVTPLVEEASAVDEAAMPLAPPRLTPEERLEEGRAKRALVPRSAHAAWQPPADRPDPIALLEESSRARLPELVPIRYGRMLGSPFTFLRGSPIVMASDLAATPATGIRVQACGDAHLMNFGLYASPERNLLFDLNDFDETLPGPWEWDVKRLAASFVVAARSHGGTTQAGLDAAQACARSYRERITEYARMRLLDVWYSRVDADAAQRVFHRGGRKGMCRTIARGRRRNSLQALSRLAAVRDGQLCITDDPPLVQHVPGETLTEQLRQSFRAYLATLQDDRRALLERYRIVDFALKVVGVGSVGTRCFILLMDGSQGEDPLFLQIKEARASVLEAHAGPSQYRNHGRRVVNGQRLMQSASDIFLGWTREGEHDYYVRQLRDMKATADLETMTGGDLLDYALLCGWVLARAHARSSDAAPIAGYLGRSANFDEAVAAFAVAYADQVEQDFTAFEEAVRQGRLPAEKGL